MKYYVLESEDLSQLIKMINEKLAFPVSYHLRGGLVVYTGPNGKIRYAQAYVSG